MVAWDLVPSALWSRLRRSSDPGADQGPKEHDRNPITTLIHLPLFCM